MTTLKNAYNALSTRYREGQNHAIKSDVEAMAYKNARAPATKAVITKIFKEIDKESFMSFLDIGAGTGAGCEVALECGFETITAIEQNPFMAKLLKELPINICEQSALSADYPSSDMVLISYMLNELDKKGQSQVLEKAFKATLNTLIIIETGTKKGFETALKAREFLNHKGMNLLAPCPHSLTCPLEATDWCHFKTRVQRSKSHKAIKNADAPFEDEPFIYMVFGKGETSPNRIIKPPQHTKFQIELTLCTKQGSIERQVIATRDKANYKANYKKEWGETID